MDVSLQAPFEAAFERLLRDATAMARPATHGPSEVHWVEQLHLLIAINLEGDLRSAIRASGSHDSVAVASAFVHGNPFKIGPQDPVTKVVEAGDLLVVGDRHANGRVEERQALLLQMKVGSPKWSSSQASTAQQAALYGAWPPVQWQSAALRALPGSHPRVPSLGPCRASQFGLIPAYRDGGPCLAMPLTGPGAFGAGHPLAVELASTVRLDIQVDATPTFTSGWPRIVQDILERSGVLTYADRTARHSDPVTESIGGDDRYDVWAAPDAGGHPRGSFLAIVVSTGAPGQLD